MLPARPVLFLLICCRWLVAMVISNESRSPVIVQTYENDTITLPCDVKDLGVEPRIRWWKTIEPNHQSDGNTTTTKKLLADSGATDKVQSDRRIRMWDNRSLEIVRMRPDDGGRYVCQAQRPEPWGHEAHVYEIQVIYPASIKIQPASGLLELKLGEEAELGCEAEGIPEPKLIWSFQSKELPSTSEGRRLRVHATNRSQAGIYTCRASNNIGDPARASVELRIKHKPEVSAIRHWLHSAPGIRAQLDCLVTSYPEASLEWLFKGKPLGRSAHLLRHKQDEQPATANDNNNNNNNNRHNHQGTITAQRHSLVIGNLKPDDYGMYECRASNEFGDDVDSIEISGAARLPKLKRGAGSVTSTSYNFIWEVDSYNPIVEYQFWFRQMKSEDDWRRLTVPNSNEPAGPLHALSFNLTGLQPATQYEALVLARNRFGWSSPSNIVRFSTSSTSGENEEAFEVDNDEIEKEPSAVQATSDFHRSSFNSSSCPERNFLALLLSVLLLLAFRTWRCDFFKEPIAQC